MWSNFHTHSYYCDGKLRPADYLQAAANNHVAVLGFSSHAPVPFPCTWCMKADVLPQYLAEINREKEMWPGIEVYKGLEVDFIPGVISPSQFSTSLDYTIGSVHFVDSFQGRRWEIDNSLLVFREGLKNIFDNDVRAAVSRYFALTREMVTSAAPDIVGHLDKIKMHNATDPFFDESEPWYRNEVNKTLEAIRSAGIIVEVNTRGIYTKKTADTYPSPWIMEWIHGMNIPVTLSSDAHHPDDLTSEFANAAKTMKDIGFKKLSILRRGTWQQVPFDEHGPEL